MIVYADPEYYAGWPANHGAWQWGDEFLVGFLRGKYKRKSMHNIAEPFEKMLARSMDGGQTWTVEKPNVDFDCLAPVEISPPFSLTDSIIRVCGVYDHGGDYCDERGGLYKSSDKGKTWEGPYLFGGIEQQDGMINTSRTRVIGNLMFMSLGQSSMWGTDYTYCIKHDGQSFSFVGTVCEDNARAVMPAVAVVGERIVAVLRRRKTAVREGWIDAFASNDRGATWCFLARVGSTGSHNGNPPALIALDDGRLLCTFGNRDEGSLVGAVSDDQGKTWRSFVVRDSESDTVDIGYPQLFMRSDGTPICVYYWSSKEYPHQHIAVSEVAV